MHNEKGNILLLYEIFGLLSLFFHWLFFVEILLGVSQNVGRGEGKKRKWKKESRKKLKLD